MEADPANEPDTGTADPDQSTGGNAVPAAPVNEPTAPTTAPTDGNGDGNATGPVTPAGGDAPNGETEPVRTAEPLAAKGGEGLWH